MSALRPKIDTIAEFSKIRLVLMDIDGTLITANRQTFSNVIVQLRKLKPLGIEFSLATGRTMFGARAVISSLAEVQMKMPPMIAYNGAVVFSGLTGMPFRRLRLDGSVVEQLARYARKNALKLIAYSCEAPPTFDNYNVSTAGLETAYSESTTQGTEFNGMKVVQVTGLKDVERDFVAVLIEYPDEEATRKSIEIVQDLLGATARVSTSGGRYLEVCGIGGTKANAMRYLAERNNLDLSQILAIGDNYNDLEMIRDAGIGVAVSNAPASVKAAAKFTCQNPAAAGVVEVLRVLVRSVRASSINKKKHEVRE